MKPILSLALSGVLLCSGGIAIAQQAYNPLSWKIIREKDVLWKKRIWREIDANTKQNTAFRYAETNAGSTNLLDILLNGVKNGSIKAYDPADDRFTHEWSTEAVLAATAPQTVTEKSIDPVSGKVQETNVSVPFAPEMANKFCVKEDWIYDKSEGKIVVRIIGIAPLKPVLAADGSTTMQPMFWIYYPNAAPALAEAKDREGMSWLDVFEKRMFASNITKITTATF